jgi:signal transduction histidine kinase/putative methionine-R-sulfoxide reductase with GAF domain
MLSTSGADYLAILSQYSTRIALSLDPDDIFNILCSTTACLAGVNGSAVFTLDLEQGVVRLARSRGLSDEYNQRNQSFLLVGDVRSRCLIENRPVRIPDASTEREGAGGGFLHGERVKAQADFPLATPDGQIGYLSVFFDDSASMEDAAELIFTMAVLAALAVSNARLHQRTDLALSRRIHQLTILETVSRELASAYHSDRLIDLILDFAMEFTNSAWGSISLVDADTGSVSMQAWRGYPAIEQVSDCAGISGRALYTKQVVNVADVRIEADYIDHSQGLARSHLSVPLLHESRLLGVLSLESSQPSAYSTSDETFINQLATQAAIALVNAELDRESQRRLHELSTLYLVSTHLVGSLDLGSVLDTIGRAMREVAGARRVGIYLWSERTGGYDLHLQIHSAEPTNDQLPANIPGIQLKEYNLSLRDTAPLTFFVHEGRLKFIFEGCREGKIIILPMVVSQQRLGMVVLYVGERPAIQETEMKLLRAISAQGAIAVQNAGLFADVRQVRDRLAAVLNSVKEGIFLIEAGGQIVLVNEALGDICGVALEEILDRRFAELPQEILASLGYEVQDARALVSTLDSGSATILPKAIIPLKSRIPSKAVERTALAVLDGTGTAVGWMVVMRDITEEQQVAQARELITETLIHDLRSPISAVLGALEVMEDTLLPVEAAEKNITIQALQVARRGAHRVLNLVETLLDIARLQSGKMDILPSPVDLYRLVVQILTEYKPQSIEFGVELSNAVPTDLPHIYADQSKLTRIIANLVDNAIKFAPTGSPVTISARMDGADQVLIAVSDNGPGIPEEYGEKIFERFTQIPGSHGRRRGTGLGLTFCRLAVEAHGGRIWVEANEHGGSLFKILLPAGSHSV